MRRVLWTLLVALLSGPVAAAPPELGAPEGAEATAAVAARADRYSLPVGRFTVQEAPVLDLQGQVAWQAFRIADRELTVASVAEGYRARAEDLGLETLLDCTGQDCGGFDFRFGVMMLPAPAMRMDAADFAQLSVRQASPEAYVSVLISRVLGSIWVQLVTVEPSETAVRITAAPEPAADLAPVTPDLPLDRELLGKLTAEGHVRLDGIDFATGGAAFAEGSDAVLDRVARLLNDQVGLRLVIVGHSDNQGGLDGNIALSRSRAEAVLEALVTRGVDRGRLEARGIGFLSPLASNATPEGRARNRRVELVLSE